LYGFTKIINIESQVITYSIKTVLILGFITIAYLNEKKHITNEN